MTSKRNDVTVKIDAYVAQRAKTAASFLGMNLAEYLSEKLLPIADADIDAEYERQRKASQTKRKEK